MVEAKEKETADFYLHARLDQGGKRRIRLRDQLVLPDCPHHLLSVGAEARRGIIGMSVEVQSGEASCLAEARLHFPDGKTSRMLNLGIIVVPDPVMPVMPVQPLERIDLEGIHPSRVSYGGYKRGVDVPAEVLHDRFNHRA